MPYSIPTAFATATVCGSLSKTIKTKKRTKILKYSQMHILSKQFTDKYKKLYTNSMNGNKIIMMSIMNLLRYMKNVRGIKKVN